MTGTRVDRARGFTLTELAVVFAIVSLLLATGMYTLSAQTEQRNFEETRRRLEAARELLLAFAVVNGRLPCPATSTPDEAFTSGTCTTSYPTATSGFLPARSIGYQVVDSAGYAVDAWGNRIRYAVSTANPVSCADTPALPHFVNTNNLRANGITCRPDDLVICHSATGITASDCGPAANALTNQSSPNKPLVAIVLSTGRNGAAGGAGIDEAANLNGDRVFVWHTPTPVGATNGEFDDQMLWIPVGELYGKLISAGLLP